MRRFSNATSILGLRWQFTKARSDRGYLRLPSARWYDALHPNGGGDASAVGATDDLAAEQGEKGTFLLVLKNGTLHAVTDYLLANGYIEYVGRDGGRSHIPLE